MFCNEFRTSQNNTLDTFSIQTDQKTLWTLCRYVLTELVQEGSRLGGNVVGRFESTNWDGRCNFLRLYCWDQA